MKITGYTLVACAVLSVMLIISGCAGLSPEEPSQYKPYKDINVMVDPIREYGGYSHEHIEGNRYAVTFRGNAFTTRAQLIKYAYRRAAELCKEEGYQTYERYGEYHGENSFTADVKCY